MLHVRSWATTIAAAGAAVLLATGSAAAASWTIVSAPPTGQNAELDAVSAVSGTDAWAVGTTSGELNGVGAKPLIDNWNGTTWTQATVPATPGNTAYLRGVSASSTTDAWAVGHTQVNREDFAPLGLHWNGTAWSVAPSFATALAGQIADGVADISPTNAWAIGGGLGSSNTGLVAQWNGSTWSRVTVPPPSSDGLNSSLDAISANGPNDVWIVGTFEDEISPTFFPNETYSLHWNGTAWSTVASPDNGSPSELFSTSASPGASTVWAVGFSGTCCSAENPLVLQNG